MSANGRRDLIRRLKVKSVFMLMWKRFNKIRHPKFCAELCQLWLATVWHRSASVASTHQLKQRKVLLPPEVLVVLRPHGGHHVVRVHDDVHYVVHEIGERPVSACNDTPHTCRTATKFSLELFWE